MMPTTWTVTTWTVMHEGAQRQSDECWWLYPSYVYKCWELCGHADNPQEKCSESKCPVKEEK